MSIKRMIKKNRGLSLVEVLLYVAILGLILPMMTTMYLHGFNSYKTNYNMIKQEETINNISLMLRKDIELAKSIKFESDKEIIINFQGTSVSPKTWKFDSVDNTLKMGSVVMAKDLDTTNCSFVKDVSNPVTVNTGSGSTPYTTAVGAQIYKNGSLILTIKPIETNNTVSKNRNFTKPIITEFSVRYKEIY